MKTDALFDMASISKSMGCGTSIMILADRGKLSVKDKETVNVPIWAGVAAIVVGGLLLVVPKKS